MSLVAPPSAEPGRDRPALAGHFEGFGSDVRVQFEVVRVEHFRELTLLVVVYSTADIRVSISRPHVLEAQVVPVRAALLLVGDLNGPGSTVLEPVLPAVSVMKADPLAKADPDYVPSLCVTLR